MLASLTLCDMYHKGELEAQARVGETKIGERNGRIITNKIIPGAGNFIEKQPFFLASSMNKEGEIYTSVIAGENGYIKVLSEGSIQINRSLINSNPYDYFWTNLAFHPKIGMLFIEPSSRRRFRVNGKVEETHDGITVSIDQAYPNCPKYIQQRHLLKAERPVYQNGSESGNALVPNLKDMIQRADTFFVGSSDEKGDLDASHRGGSPGFISIETDGSLLIPDYQGNSMFNTLGNFLMNPKAGLLFIDFENHKTLQLTGAAEIVWNAEDSKSVTGGTGRFWKFLIKKWLLLDNLKGYEWNFAAYSPFNPKL